MSFKSIKPTLIMGLGKQGRKILEEFKSELYSRYERLPAIQLLALDFKEDVMEEERQITLLKQFFLFKLSGDLLENWFKGACGVFELKSDRFIEEHKLSEKNLKDLLNSVLKKPEGDLIDINIDEKPYVQYGLEDLKDALRNNAKKFETAGIAQIEKLIEKNRESLTDKILISMEDELKPSKLVDSKTLDYLETLEKTCKNLETFASREFQETDKEVKRHQADWIRFLDETVTDSALPDYRKKIINTLDKKFDLTVFLKGYGALLTLFEKLKIAISTKLEKTKKRIKFLSYIEKKLKEQVGLIKPDETLEVYIEQKRNYEKLKARIKRLSEKFGENILGDWFELDNEQEAFSRFKIFCEKSFPFSSTGGKLRLGEDELVLLPREIPKDIPEKSKVWAEYKKWLNREIAEIKQKEPSWEDIKETRRAWARSIFWSSVPDISNKLDHKLREVSLITNRKILNEKGFELEEANDFDVFLISPVHDALGAGMFIDMIYLTEERIKTQHGTLNPFACLLLPGPVEMEKEDKNILLGTSYSSLAELDYFLSGKLFKEDYYPGVYEVESSEKPFKMVFLVDYLNSRGFALQSELERNYMCREILLAMILSPLGVNLKSLPQITASLQRKISGKNTSYGSFGITLLTFPAPLVRKYASFRLGERILSCIYIRDDMDQGKLEKNLEVYLNRLESSLEGSFIPTSPKLDRKQFEKFEPSVVCDHIKMEAGLLESKFVEGLEKEFSGKFKENLEKLKKGFQDSLSLLSEDTDTALKSAKVFIEKISGHIKTKKVEFKKKHQNLTEMVQENEKNHLKNFDDFKKMINSFTVPILGIVVPPKSINLLGCLSFTPILLIIALIIITPIGWILTLYLAPLGWYLWSWKKYFDRYWEIQDALFNHIDKKILDRGQLMSFDFRLKKIEQLEEFFREYEEKINRDIKKLYNISQDFKEDAQDIKEQIFIPRGSLISLLITEEELETYRKDSMEDLPKEARGLYEHLGNWDLPAPDLKKKIGEFLWERFLFIEETSVDDVLKRKEGSLDKMEETLKMTYPFWTIDEIILSQNVNREKIYFCGVSSSEKSYLAEGLKKKPQLSNMTTFSLNDPHSIFMGQIETGIPLYALKVVTQMKKSHNFLSGKKFFRTFKNITTEPFPLKMTPKYNEIRKIYLPAYFLELYKPPLNMNDDEIYQNLADNPDILSVIQGKLEKFIKEKESGLVKVKLLEMMGEKEITPADREFVQEFIKEL